MGKTARVVIADDHPLVRAGIRTALSSEGTLTIVGEATDAQEARALCLELKPDVLLLDLSMPGPSAKETVLYLREHCPETKVVMLTAYDDDAYVRGLVAAGVAGYVLKDEVPETVTRALHTVMGGDTWFSSSVAERLIREKVSGPYLAGSRELTPREVQILRLLVRGKTDREIGEELALSERTVRHHLRRVYDKLGVNTRVEATARAVKLDALA